MRYWTFMNGEVPGSFTAEELAKLPGFSMTTLVCPAQGEIAEKNWRRAGEFGDIAAAVTAREKSMPPPAPAPAPSASPSADVDAMIDTASTRLFSHVADLMKELENRREEKGLIVSLQRQIAALKEELAQTRERANLLEVRLPRIAELEEAARKDAAALQSLQASLQSRDAALNETRIAGEQNRNDLDAARRRLQETTNDLALRNRLVDKLSKELSEKELSLAKSLGVIRRLEEDLNRLCPPAEPAPSPRAALPAGPAPAESVPVEPPALTGPAIPLAPEPLSQRAVAPSGDLPPAPAPLAADEPAAPRADEPPGKQPQAQEALVSFLKRVFPNQPQ